MQEFLKTSSVLGAPSSRAATGGLMALCAPHFTLTRMATPARLVITSKAARIPAIVARCAWEI